MSWNYAPNWKERELAAVFPAAIKTTVTSSGRGEFDITIHGLTDLETRAVAKALEEYRNGPQRDIRQGQSQRV